MAPTRPDSRDPSFTITSIPAWWLGDPVTVSGVWDGGREWVYNPRDNAWDGYTPYELTGISVSFVGVATQSVTAEPPPPRCTWSVRCVLDRPGVTVAAVASGTERTLSPDGQPTGHGQVTDDPVIGTGVCGHSTGAAQHWGHSACPGQAIMDQRQQVVDAAQLLLGGQPAVLRVSPTAGSASGGDTVTITGVGLSDVTAVSFGSTPALDVAVQSATQLTVTSPAPTASGAVDVTVTTAQGLKSSTSADDLVTYNTPEPQIPMVTSLAPRIGSAGGGDTLRVTGTSLNGATDVLFGQNSGSDVTVLSDTQLTVISPPPTSSGAVSVSAMTPLGTSPVSANLFTIADLEAPPTVSNVNPDGGGSAGGDVVTVTGTGFTSALSVGFGSAAAGDLNVVSATQLTVVSPPATVSGAVDVVYSGQGSSVTGPDDQFTHD